MKKLFVVAVVFFLMTGTHSEAQPGQKEKGIKEDKICISLPRNAFKVQYGSKVQVHNMVSLKNKVRKWKREMVASSKSFELVKLRGNNVLSYKNINMTAMAPFQESYGRAKQPFFAGPVPGVNSPALILPTVDDKSGVNVELSKKASLSLDFGNDDKTDVSTIIEDDSSPDIDISVGLLVAIR